MPHVGLLTCVKHPDGAPDDRPIADHLNALGISAGFAVWDAPALYQDSWLFPP